MSDLLPVEEAQARLLALRAPLGIENIALYESLGRYLSQDVLASRDQPAAALSAMDGYAIRFDDFPGPWHVIGEAAAGSVPALHVDAGQAMRIFTGAILPEGADTVIVQEDVALSGGHSRDAANQILAQNHGIIASFSRALSEGLSAKQTEGEFDKVLKNAVDSIHAASIT